MAEGRLGSRLLDAAAVVGNEVLPDVLGDVLDLPAAADLTGAIRSHGWSSAQPGP